MKKKLISVCQFVLILVCIGSFSLAVTAGCHKYDSNGNSSCGCADAGNWGGDATKANNHKCAEEDCWYGTNEIYGVQVGKGCDGHSWVRKETKTRAAYKEDPTHKHTVYSDEVCTKEYRDGNGNLIRVCGAVRNTFESLEDHNFTKSVWVNVGKEDVCRYKYYWCDQCYFNVFNTETDSKLKNDIESGKTISTNKLNTTTLLAEVDTKHNYETTKYIPATCINEGVKVQECQDCGYVKETVLERDRSNHIEDRDKRVHELTCTQDASVDWYCAGCGEFLKREVEEKAPGHNWVWRVDSNLDCLHDYIGHKECTRGCHDTNVDGPKETAFDTVFAKAPEHNFNKFVCDKAATCTEAGSGHYECSNVINGNECREIGRTVTIPATGHHITYDKVTEKPSVYTNGTRTYYCEYCNKPVATRDVLHRNFNIYLGGKRVTMITKGDDIVWNGSYGEQGSDGGKTSTDDVNSLVESNWYYDY